MPSRPSGFLIWFCFLFVSLFCQKPDWGGEFRLAIETSGVWRKLEKPNRVLLCICFLQLAGTRGI